MDKRTGTGRIMRRVGRKACRARVAYILGRAKVGIRYQDGELNAEALSSLGGEAFDAVGVVR